LLQTLKYCYNNMFDLLIIGGGVAGMQCALVVGSATGKPYAENKKTGIVLHQKASYLKSALFNNVLGVPSGTTGAEILSSGLTQIQTNYPEIDVIEKEKVSSIFPVEGGYKVTTNKNEYITKVVVVALNHSPSMKIEGLKDYLETHQRANPMKGKVQLKNYNYFIKEGLYVCGTLAGLPNQYPIAAGSGASVAIDVLTQWNDGLATQIHDSIKK